jgi:hypothetical protein
MLLFASAIAFAQQKTANAFADYEEFTQNKPSLHYNFELKGRAVGDVFMVGGITNWKVKKVKPSADADKVEKEIWGITINDTSYINSYPYSKVKGYNRIIEKGYYSYFIGEPARMKEEKIKLGMIAQNEVEIVNWRQVGYVILPDGTVRFLRPELLSELCSDNAALKDEVDAANFRPDSFFLMFEILKKYNQEKK